jgi:hypothetical protein
MMTDVSNRTGTAARLWTNGIFTAVKTRVRLWQNVVPTYTCASSGPMAVPLLGG